MKKRLLDKNVQEEAVQHKKQCIFKLSLPSAKRTNIKHGAMDPVRGW